MNTERAKEPTENMNTSCTMNAEEFLAKRTPKDGSEPSEAWCVVHSLLKYTKWLEAERGNEVITPELKAKIAEQFEKSSNIIEGQSAFVEELQRRLSLAEKVCYAANSYIRHINSPLAVGWDMLLGALKAWTSDPAKKEAGV